MSAVPDWANELTQKVCKDYKRTPPRVVWREHSRKYSSGVTYTRADRISIRAGNDQEDVKLVLLHELAHHVLAKSKKGRREHHSLRFWRIAYAMYDKYGVDIEYAYDREKNYMQKSRWAYAELKTAKESE